MQTVGPNDCFKWVYPAEQEPNVDSFALFVDGVHTMDVPPDTRSTPISSLTTVPGSYRVDVAPKNAMGEAPKAGIDYRLVTGVPVAVQEVSVGPCAG